MPGRTPGEPIAGSYRDPAGYVFARDGRIFRAIDPECSDLLHGLADTLLPSLGFVVWSATALPRVYEHALMPSTHYRTIIGRLDRVVGTQTLLTDRIVLRAAESSRATDIDVSLAADGQWFQASRSRRCSWSPSRQRSLWLDVVSLSSSQAVSIVLSAPGGGKRVVIEPIEAANWRRWQATGLDGVSFLWAGGGAPPGPTVPPSANGGNGSVAGQSSTPGSAPRADR